MASPGSSNNLLSIPSPSRPPLPARTPSVSISRGWDAGGESSNGEDTTNNKAAQSGSPRSFRSRLRAYTIGTPIHSPLSPPATASSSATPSYPVTPVTPSVSSGGGRLPQRTTSQILESTAEDEAQREVEMEALSRPTADATAVDSNKDGATHPSQPFPGPPQHAHFGDAQSRASIGNLEGASSTRADPTAASSSKSPPTAAAANESSGTGWARYWLPGGRRRAATTSVTGRDYAAEDAAAHRVDGGGVGPGGIGGAPITSSASTGRRRGASTSSRHSAQPSSTDILPPGVNNPRSEAYDARVHDLLDVIDPEIQVLNTLGDVQNSFFIPYTGFFDRTRKIQLTKAPCYEHPAVEDADGGGTSTATGTSAEQQQGSTPQKQLSRRTATKGGKDLEKLAAAALTSGKEGKGPSKTSAAPTEVDEDGNVEEPSLPVDTDTTVVGEDTVVKGKYFILPSSLVDMSDWTEQEKADLDDYVRHLLHSRKEKARRSWRGFKKYVKTPLGCFVTIYASLLTFWGAAWVLFLIGWIPAGDRQAYFVEICDQILVALFCLTGLGLIPWRTVDTYHAYFIIKYHHKTLKRRKKRGLPPLSDENDLPNNMANNHDLEMAGHAQDIVLSDEEQALLAKHQAAFHKSHTYYRPHDTFTHRAFPINILIAIIVLTDFHSIFQLSLGSTTWSISYHENYKKIITTIILCFSLSCNISGGILIAVGNRMSRKTEVVENLMKQAITEEALRRKKDAEKYRAEKRMEAEREQEKRLLRRHTEGDENENGSEKQNGGGGSKIHHGSFVHNVDEFFRPHHRHSHDGTPHRVNSTGQLHKWGGAGVPRNGGTASGSGSSTMGLLPRSQTHSREISEPTPSSSASSSIKEGRRKPFGRKSLDERRSGAKFDT